MDDFLFTHWHVATTPGILIGIAAGLLLGLFHFATLKWNTRFYLAGDHAMALLLHTCRFLVLIVAMTMLAKAGAAPLLAAMASLLAARTLILRLARRVP